MDEYHIPYNTIDVITYPYPNTFVETWKKMELIEDNYRTIKTVLSNSIVCYPHPENMVRYECKLKFVPI